MCILSCFCSWWEIGEACGWRDPWNLPPSSTILRKPTTRNRISQCLAPHPEQYWLNYLRVPLWNYLKGWVATRERKKEKQLQKRREMPAHGFKAEAQDGDETLWSARNPKCQTMFWCHIEGPWYWAFSLNNPPANKRMFLQQADRWAVPVNYFKKLSKRVP